MQFDTEILAMKKMRNEIGMVLIVCYCLIPAKGQLISKYPFGIIVWTKIPTKLFLDFCPEIFCTFLGTSWKLFGASCRLPCL